MSDAPTDIVNAFFRGHYPEDHATNWEMRPIRNSYGREYLTRNQSYIFPPMECADGFQMSVQGHCGAYCWPNDDFADAYKTVEILCPPQQSLKEWHVTNVDDEELYAFVPISAVEAVIESHGGLKP